MFWTGAVDRTTADIVAEGGRAATEKVAGDRADHGPADKTTQGEDSGKGKRNAAQQRAHREPDCCTWPEPTPR